MNMGPRQPRGFTPCSRYMRMVSWEMRCRSFLKRSWSSLSLGCKPDMAFIWRLCFTVRGTRAARTTIVKPMIAKPKLLKNMLYNSTRLLIIGPMMTALQTSPISSTV